MSEKGKLNFSKYKSLIIAITIIIIVIILDIIFENYSRISIKKLNGNIEKINKIFESQPLNTNMEKLEKLSNNSREEWKKREKFLSCFIEHDEVEKIEIKLDILYVQIKNKLLGDARSTTVELKQLIEYLEGKYKLSVQNIF